MEGLCRHVGGKDVPIPYKDVTVNMILFGDKPQREKGQYTDFRAEGLDVTIHIPIGTYPLHLGEMIRVFDSQGFQADSHGRVHPEGMQHLDRDGRPIREYYIKDDTQFYFKEMPPG